MTLAARLPFEDFEPLSLGQVLIESGIKRLSPSSIENFYKCPEQWRREKLDKEPRPATAAMIFGSAFHKAAELNFRPKITSGEDLPVKEMRDLTGDAFNVALEEEMGQREILWEDSHPGKLQEGVVSAMVGNDVVPGYHQTLAPSVKPVAVERWLEVDTPVGLPLLCRLDVEEIDDGITDFKTSKKAKTQSELDDSIQATAYLWARRREGSPASSFRWHTAIRTIAPQRQELETKRSEFQIAQFEQVIITTAQTIFDYLNRYGPEGPWPGTTPMAWWCSPKMCSFWSTCPWRRN